MNNEAIKCNDRESQILAQLRELCLARMGPGALPHLPPPERWPKTREVADECDEDIYATRTLLLALEKKGKVHCTHRSINNSLRWFINVEDMLSDLNEQAGI
ncbi:hypothetical protein [Yersinia frederiksenii]|uniref:hypothetical protein n=1 Tax=Yersinia frederiksenii TaxID=29484 RepID=UPI0005E9826C|nr:hypothetical protein [Yersinia frederiksenii]CNG45404.1 Uncharacterised protein [Yersinia frederiksenii]